ncbi:TIM barrel domain-containing protein [Knoellia sinensis KCTC 19936]|uniref:TIM barrel domain-containing protein n=1 Tax=Knoellia sinensis KCTC 19936 TaxID=1385520 RepID=A0A0A0JDJ8_9MICO|nr:sugar phosphate isomerase/epimerase family protein [Knoellia sinensis]KGN34884.1 TIM barrel domain-containing protein [Knoellia sinensis KCTC 19936]
MSQPPVVPDTWPRDALGASSLGMPGAHLRDFLATVVAHGCTSVELRVGEGEVVPRSMASDDAEAVGDVCRRAGVEVLALASYVKVCAPGDDDVVIGDLVEHLRLAAAIGAGGVRVFPGGVDGGPEDDVRGGRRIAGAAVAAEELGARILMETHDSHPRAVDVERILRRAGVGDRTVGVIWDAAHPWIAGEDPAATAAVLQPWLAHVQLKDVAARQRGAEPVLTGHGILPLGEVLDALDDRELRLPLVLEWEKAWFEGIPELAEALAATGQWLSGHRPTRHS